VHDALDGKTIRAIRASLGMSEVQFALLFGVTIRTVELWEADVVVPSRITAMVIRAEAERARSAAAADDGAGPNDGARPESRSSRTRGRIVAPRSARSRRRA
jgi:transcriptional regulator with XRE-family HTH domain